MSVPFVPIRATLLDNSCRGGANAAPRHVDGQANRIVLATIPPRSAVSATSPSPPLRLSLVMTTPLHISLIPPIVPRFGLLLASLFDAAMPKQEPVPVGRKRFASDSTGRQSCSPSLHLSVSNAQIPPTASTIGSFGPGTTPRQLRCGVRVMSRTAEAVKDVPQSFAIERIDSSEGSD